MLRLLGPVELISDQRSLDLGGPRQRVVLTMLALRANRVVPVDQLIDAVWNSSPPSTARGQIQICISALRKVFGDAGAPDAIRTRPPGYILEIAESELDILQFGALVSRARQESDSGRLEEAAATLSEALGLWRGSALSGISSEVVQRAALPLDDQRLAAVEERIRLDLALGKHEELCGELRTLLDDNPLRERLHGFLMLALYRAGRQADALEVGRAARAVLIEEIGIEPGQELQDLERAILNRDPSLNAPAAPKKKTASGPAAQHAPAAEAPMTIPRQLPASITDFTGRDELISVLRAGLESDPSQTRYAVPIMAISGKGGVGKSSVAVRVAHEVADRFPDGHLYADLRTHSGDETTARLLARFLRSLGVPGTAVPSDLEERVELYRSRVSGKRLLLVLDDVTSEAQVLPLLPGSASCAVITTSRVRLSGLPGAQWFDVDVFDVDQSTELLARIIGHERVATEPEASVELIRFCGGLPLALRIAGARLASRPHLRIDGLVRRLRDEARRLDEFEHHGLGLRTNIGLTYKALDQDAQRLFQLFSLIRAPEFPSWTAAALLDIDIFDAEDILESLVDAQLVDTVEYADTTTTRYRFHDLIQIYASEKLAESTTAEERTEALARLLGAWLALAEEAHRREYGGDFTILHGDAPRWPDATWAKVGITSNPIDWLDSERRSLVAAVRQAAQAGLDELCWDLALTSVTLFESKGYFDDWMECAQIAMTAAERADNRTGIAAMRYSLGTLHMFQTRLGEAARYFREALDGFREEGDEHGQALVLRNDAHVDGLRGNVQLMLDKYAEALVTMRKAGDRIGEAHILRSLAKHHLEEGSTATARELLDEAVRISRETKCLRVEAQVEHRVAELYVATGQIDQARRSLHRVLQIVRDTGDRIGETYALYSLGVVRHKEGRLDNAETTLVHALDLARKVGERLIEAKALYALGQIDLARSGGGGAGTTHLERARLLFEELGSALWQAKTLLALSEAAEDGQQALTAVGRAAELLAPLESKESAQLLAEIEIARSALESTVQVGGYLETGS
ncbi:DNA-binding transcriptional activator of the SARP family [Lentzea fradiae]|uniref:DNA-binding transcriptional activator of the SARP family n=1 Tax=Lentzea fradiae TaxID=200378 RepID=A0A1G7UP42_9PSEU|nr:BTAD domain-containing putative transcriptional regulator [Lentzea fradiae]SDG49001.1 DNA-binding transcriptional activator of the SARP family [Lentzea fradiae]